LLVGIDGVIMSASQVISFAEFGPDDVFVGVFFRGGLLCLGKFRGGLVGKIGDLGLCCVTLIGGSFRGIVFGFAFLIQQSGAGGEMCLHAFKFGFFFLLFLDLFGGLHTLLGNDVLKIEVSFRLGAALDLNFGFIRFIRSR
jgi:hypothetical protein